MITFMPQMPALQLPRNPVARPATPTPEPRQVADDGWQQQDLRRFALTSKPLDMERLRMQGWQQGLPVPELGMADWLSEGRPCFEQGDGSARLAHGPV